MTEILRFIAEFCSFLWRGGRYRIVDSRVATSFGGDAFVVVSSDSLRLRFVSDRGQLFLDIQGVTTEDDEWYSIDLLWRLITGERRDSAELDAAYAEFLQQSIEEIESRFADEEHWPEIRKRLHELKRRRAKELFG